MWLKLPGLYLHDLHFPDHDASVLYKNHPQIVLSTKLKPLLPAVRPCLTAYWTVRHISFQKVQSNRSYRLQLHFYLFWAHNKNLWYRLLMTFLPSCDSLFYFWPKKQPDSRRLFWFCLNGYHIQKTLHPQWA
ncbi:hypothetical protein D9M68_674860 [compost metagenome]